MLSFSQRPVVHLVHYQPTRWINKSPQSLLALTPMNKPELFFQSVQLQRVCLSVGNNI